MTHFITTTVKTSDPTQFILTFTKTLLRTLQPKHHNNVNVNANDERKYNITTLNNNVRLKTTGES
jgi:hypothetical protein